MGKWLNGAREVCAAMDTAGAAQIAGQVPVATARLALYRWPAVCQDT